MPLEKYVPYYVGELEAMVPRSLLCHLDISNIPEIRLTPNGRRQVKHRQLQQSCRKHKQESRHPNKSFEYSETFPRN